MTASRRLVVKKAAADPSAATTSELLQDDEGGARCKALHCARTVKKAAFIQNEYQKWSYILISTKKEAELDKFRDFYLY